MSSTNADTGRHVLHGPLRNRGTAFDHVQRRELGLTGRLPSAVETLDEQATRCWAQLQALSSDVDRYVYLDLAVALD